MDTNTKDFLKDMQISNYVKAFEVGLIDGLQYFELCRANEEGRAPQFIKESDPHE